MTSQRIGMCGNDMHENLDVPNGFRCKRMRRPLIVHIFWICALCMYVVLLLHCRAVGRRLATDPHLRTWSGLPASMEPVPKAAPLELTSRWWRPADRYPATVEFGAVILNNQATVWREVSAVGRAYDRHGRLVAMAVRRCSPSTLKPGETAECTGTFTADREVLRFFMDVAGTRD